MQEFISAFTSFKQVWIFVITLYFKKKFWVAVSMK